MAIKPYLTSATLVEAVKRDIAVPFNQLTYTDEDILAFANTELFSAQMPSVLQYHEEFYVYEQEVVITANKSKYPIPSRAIGMKLRDLWYVDQQGNLIEMSKINPDDRSHFAGDFDRSQSAIHYYIQNNNIVLVPDVGPNPTGSLLFSYFLRPNSLVPVDQAIIAASFSKEITVENATIVSGDTVTIRSFELEAGVDFAIGANSSITANNLVTAITALNSDISAVAASNLITITYTVRPTTLSTSNSTGFVVSNDLIINSTQAVPEDIVAGVMVDFLQTDGGHSTYKFDVLVENNNVSATSIKFDDGVVPEDFSIGDYICLQYECIVPQLPTDLHNLLVQRTCSRVLSAQGDQMGLDNTNKKIQDLEARQATLIDNRVDGSPTKVFNRHSLLRYGRSNRRRY